MPCRIRPQVAADARMVDTVGDSVWSLMGEVPAAEAIAPGRVTAAPDRGSHCP
jgi:hypothetical protein